MEELVFITVSQGERKPRTIALPSFRRIGTNRGTVPVEELRVGDTVTGGYVRGKVLELRDDS